MPCDNNDPEGAVQKAEADNAAKDVAQRQRFGVYPLAAAQAGADARRRRLSTRTENNTDA